MEVALTHADNRVTNTMLPCSPVIIIAISHLNPLGSGRVPAAGEVLGLGSEKGFLDPLQTGWRPLDRFVVVVIVLFINLVITQSSATSRS